MRSIKITFLFSFFFLIYLSVFSKEKNTCKKVEDLLYLIKKLHYESLDFDEKFNATVIQTFLFKLDGQCKYFYSADLEALKHIQESETKTEDVCCKSFDFIAGIFVKRLSETDSLLNACINKKNSWKKDDTLFFYRSFKNNYPKNIDTKNYIIEHWLKLYMLHQLETADRLDKDFEFEKNIDIKGKAINKFQKNINKIISTPKGITQYLEEALLQAIALSCDPHSDYFTKKGKDDFSESLSTSAESYGFTVDENKNKQIEITSIQPGSPAWKCNSLNKGDQITEILFKGRPKIDVTEFSKDEFEQLMSKSPEKEMDISVLKNNSLDVKIHLVKAFLKSEDNVINSYVLSKTKPIGYIPLPSFYTDFSGYTPLGCANDIAREIVKLKKENIEGLILDLRNNGGGSLQEAINLAGIFIDAAPLCIEKLKSQKPRVLKDMNRGRIYEGPLLILINKTSASASEILAQMLKSQQRAIIVGDNSFGKATGQIIIPLDTSTNLINNKNDFYENNDFLKITIEKFYDLSGSTHQQIGVMPHIKLPDLWNKLPIGEKEYANALDNDIIDKKIILDILPDEKIKTCAELSTKRIRNNKQFVRIDSIANCFLPRYKNNTIILNPVNYAKLIENERMLDSIAVTAIQSEDSSFTIEPVKQNTEVMKMDEFLHDVITLQLNNLKKDIIIQEAYNILSDYNSN